MSVRFSIATRRFATGCRNSPRFAALTRLQLSTLAIVALLVAGPGAVAQEAGQTQMSSVTQAPVEKSRQAIIECREKRLNGELSSYADSARCAKPLIFEAWKEANYPHMDLIAEWLSAREAASEKVDQKLISPEQFEREMTKLTLRLTKEEQSRRGGLPPSAVNTLRLQVQLPTPSTAGGSTATSGTQKPATKKNASVRTLGANAYADPSQGSTVASTGSPSQFGSPKRLVNTAGSFASAAPNSPAVRVLGADVVVSNGVTAPDPAAATAMESAHLVAPSDVAQPQQATAAMASVTVSEPRVPTIFVEPEPPAESPQGTDSSWLLLGMLGGGVVGATIVWLLAGSETGRAHATPTREEGADQPRRYNWAPAYDDRWADLRGSEERDPPWRHHRSSAYDDRWDSRERQEADLSSRHNPAPAYDDRRHSRERREADLPSRYNGASAYDALGDALRYGAEADQDRGYNWFSYRNR